MQRVTWFSIGIFLTLCGSVWGEAPPALPTSPEQWVNSSPLSATALRGKAVFFWFFEEECPSDRQQVPRDRGPEAGQGTTPTDHWGIALRRLVIRLAGQSRRSLVRS